MSLELYVYPFVSSGLQNITDITVDSNHNVYVLDNNTLYKFTAADNYVRSTLYQASVVAIAAYSDFIYLLLSDRVKKYNIVSETVDSNSVISSFSSATAFCVDSATGDMYIAAGSEVKKYLYSSGIFSSGSDITGLSAPSGLVFLNNALYITDSNAVYKWTSAGGTTLFKDGFNVPTRITCDSSGNLFVVDSDTHEIFNVPSGGSIKTSVIDSSPIPTAFSTPTCLAMDTSHGVLYVGDATKVYAVYSKNYIGKYMFIDVQSENYFGTDPIIFAGGIIKLSGDFTFSNPITFLKDSFVVADGHTLTLLGSCTGTGKLYRHGEGNVLAPSSNIIVEEKIEAFFEHDDVGYLLTAGVINSYVSVVNTNPDPNATPTPTINSPSYIFLLNFGTINAGSSNLTIDSTIFGPGGLTFMNGSVNLNKPALYTGSTVINNDVNLKACENALQYSTSTTVNGIFDLNGNPQILNDLTGSGIIKDTAAPPQTPEDPPAATLTLNNNNEKTFRGVLDTKSLIFSGWKPLKLDNPIPLFSGTVSFSSSNHLSIIDSSVFSKLSSVSNFTLNNSMLLFLSGIIDLSTIEITYENSYIFCIGSGSVTFKLDYSGPVYYYEPDVNITNASNYTSVIKNEINPSGDLIINYNDDDVTAKLSEVPSGNIYFFVAGTLELDSTDVIFPNNIYLYADGIISLNGQNLTLNGVIDGPNSLTIENNSVNSGTLTLTERNTYSKGTTIKPNVTVEICHALNLGTGAITLSGGNIKATENLTLNQSITLLGNSTIDTNGKSIICNGTINLGSYSLSITGGGTLTTNGTIQSPENVFNQIKVRGGSTFIPKGNYIEESANSHSDLITISNATIEVDGQTIPHNVAIGSGAHLKIKGNCSLNLRL